MKDGESAFPCTRPEIYSHTDDNGRHHHVPGGFEPGISIRDYFAAAALKGLLATDEDITYGAGGLARGPYDYAAIAYSYADAMLAERAK
jgi:hypothetical protein